MTAAAIVLGIMVLILFLVAMELRGSRNLEKSMHELTKEDRDFYKNQLIESNDFWSKSFDTVNNKWGEITEIYERMAKEAQASSKLLNERVIELLEKEIENTKEINMLNIQLQDTSEELAQYEYDDLEEESVN